MLYKALSALDFLCVLLKRHAGAERTHGFLYWDGKPLFLWELVKQLCRDHSMVDAAVFFVIKLCPILLVVLPGAACSSVNGSRLRAFALRYMEGKMKGKQLVAMLLSAVLAAGTVAGPVYASEGAGRTAGTGQTQEAAAELEEILSENALFGEVSGALEEEAAEQEADAEETADEVSVETPAPDSEAGREEEAAEETAEEAAPEDAGDPVSEEIADDAGEADADKEGTASEAAEDEGRIPSEPEEKEDPEKEDSKPEEMPSVTEEKEDSSSGPQEVPEGSASEKKTDKEKAAQEKTAEDPFDVSSEKSGAETGSGEKKEKDDPSDAAVEEPKEDSREETIEQSAEEAVEVTGKEPEAEPAEEIVSEEPALAADSYPVIPLGEWTPVTVTEEEPEARFLFTAQQAGKYYFYSEKAADDPDTLGIIYDLEEYELDSNAWGADEGNFKVTFEAEPGESVILGARFYDAYEGSFNVIVEKEPAVLSLSAVAQKVVLEGTDCSCEYGEDGHEWFYYDPYVFEPVFTVVTETGERAGTSEELYYDYGYEIELSAEQSEDTAWGVGTHTVTATLNGVSCEFEVEIGESSVFEQTAVIDGLTLTVTAERGCFPQDAVLTAESISGTEKEQYRSRAEDCHYDELFRVSDYAFRLAVTDGSGNVFLPPDGYVVNIIVNGAETAESNLTPHLYGFKGNEEEKEYWLEQQDDAYRTETDLYFPAYYLEFTYGKLTYSLKSGSSVELSSLIGDAGLTGTVTNVVCSNADLLSASEENGEWTLTSLQPFDFEEWIKVTVNGLEYQIFISDADVIASGTLESGVRWILNSDGLMSITGSGSMGDLWDSPWWDDRDEIVTVLIQEGVTDVGGRAFCECANLTSVSIPGSVTSIGYEAFSSCPKLQTVSLAEGLKTIEERAFSGDTFLETITLPGTVTTLGEAFLGGTAVSTVTVPAKVAEAESAFADAMNLERVVFAEGITRIPDNLFGYSGYIYVSGVTLPEGVKEIGSGAFENCAALESIDLPESLETIGNNAFSKSGLKTITLPAAVRLIDEEAFSECVSLTAVTMTDNDTQIRTPEGWKLYFLEIMNNAFENCTALTSVSFSKNVTTIANSTFKGCRSLADLDLPVNLEFLGYGAFQGTGIASIVIPASLTDISDNAFYGASYLETVSFAEGTASIPDCCFSNGDGISYIKNVILPDSLTEIGSYAFYSNENLEEVNIPVNVSRIGDCAFEDCPKLANVSLSENDSTIRTEAGDVPFSLEIESQAFANCGSLADLQLPQSVSYIGDRAFANTGLTAISLGQNLREIGESFISGTKISSVTVPAGVKDAGGAFENTTSLQEVVFADGTVTIPYGICRNNEGRTRITGVVIPEGVKTIEYSAFEKCTRLTSIAIPGSVTEIHPDAFSGCDLLLYVYKNSYAELWAIENDFRYQYLSGETGDDDDKVLDLTASSYYTNADITTVNSYIPLYLTYKVKKADRNLVSNMRLTFQLSSSLDLVDGTVCLDGEPYSEYDFDNENNTVTIWLEEEQYEGSVQFYVRPVSVGRIASYAAFSYNMGSGSYMEVIGTISLEVPVLTMQAPAKTSDTGFEVSGLTEPKEKVNLYIGDTKITTVTARKDGAYAATLVIPGTPVNGKAYTVKAALNRDSDISASSRVVYQENTPELLSFEMYYNNHGESMVDLLATKGARQTISYEPGTPLTFRICFSNADQLKKVYVSSTKGKEEKKIQALPSGKEGEYVASGFFDPNDLNYLPGTVFVVYQTASSSYDVIGAVDFETEVSDPWKNPNVNREVDDNGEYKGTVTNKDGDEVGYEIHEGTPQDIGSILIDGSGSYPSASAVIDGYYNKIHAHSGFSILIKTDDTLIYMKGDFEIGYVYKGKNGQSLVWETIRSTGKKVEEIFRESIRYNPYGAGQALGEGLANAIYCGFNTYVDSTNAKEEILKNPNLNAAQKAVGIGILLQMDQLNNALSAFRIINSTVKAALIYSGHPVLAAGYEKLSGLLESLAQDFIDKSILFARDGKFFSLKWLIDPSGYVYEAVTDNYIENATVTAWYKENESAAPVIWDAEEDGQVNPLYTDSKGFYAWDTPEGLWQVVVEKAGYETWTSEWLTVPPIQTDVNAALISEEDPFVEWVEADENQIQIQFSQFMDPESVGRIKVKNSSGQEMNYTLVYDTSRTSAEGRVYADYYSFQLTGSTLSEGERCTIVVPEAVKNYAGKEVSAEEIRTVRSVNRVLTVQEEAEAAYTKTTVIPVTVTNADDTTVVSADSTAPLIAKVVSVEKSGNDTWLVTVYGALPGTADILISLNNSAVSKAVAFTVTNDGQAQDTVEVESITITAAQQQIPVGGTLQLTANVLPENASDKTVIWAVDKSSVASIDSSGLLTGQHEGAVQIVARAKVGNAVAVYTVTVGESHTHTLEQVAAAAPTLDAAGNIAYYRCKGCGRLFSDAAGENEIHESDTVIAKLIDISAAEVTGITARTYNGEKQTQNPAVVVDGTALKKGTDYTLSYKNNLDAGTATVTIRGKGLYGGSLAKTFKINKAAQTITVKASAASVAVGKTATISVTGALGTKTYKSSNTTVATVTAAGKVVAKKVGVATITATSGATANYNAASKTVKIKVVPAATESLTAVNQATGIKLTWKKVTGANGYKVYRGSTLVKTITSGATVTYTDTKANTNGTKYTFKIVAKAATGDSTLSKSLTTYRVARPAVSSAANSAAGKMTVKWAKNAKANGYQIQYSTSKTFASGNKAVSVTSASTVSKVITGLTRGKTYYVRIRTYKTVGGTKYWSAWSAAKTQKITK